jgi:DNA-directed RNA polymerase specialized sigma24 family protein
VGRTATAASAHEVIAVEPVIRRVVAARAAPADVDDLVQDCLERLLSAHKRLDAGTVLPYAIVTAQNLVASHATNAARRARVLPRVLDMREPDRPEDVVLARESRRAMMTALSRLSPDERREVLTYHGHAGLDLSVLGDPVPARPVAGAPVAGASGAGAPVAGASGATRKASDAGAVRSPGATRVRMARIRAKLRLEYLLAFRRAELPTLVCYPVLLAISSGDTRRQRELDAGQHLLDCATCATLSEPLDQRSVAMTAITLPVGLLAWAVNKARAQPAHAVAATTAISAAVVTAVLAPPLFAAHPPRPPHRVPHPAAPVQVISHLVIAGRLVPQASVRHSVRSLIGKQVSASGVTVQSVVAHNGFWVGTPSARLWVELVGPLEPLHIQPGERVRFTGVVTGQQPSFPRQAGVSGTEGAGLLAAQGAHIDVSTTKIAVIPPH